MAEAGFGGRRQINFAQLSDDQKLKLNKLILNPDRHLADFPEKEGNEWDWQGNSRSKGRSHENYGANAKNSQSNHMASRYYKNKNNGQKGREEAQWEERSFGRNQRNQTEDEPQMKEERSSEESLGEEIMFQIVMDPRKFPQEIWEAFEQNESRSNEEKEEMETLNEDEMELVPKEESSKGDEKDEDNEMGEAFGNGNELIEENPENEREPNDTLEENSKGEFVSDSMSPNEHNESQAQDEKTKAIEPGNQKEDDPLNGNIDEAILSHNEKQMEIPIDEPNQNEEPDEKEEPNQNEGETIEPSLSQQTRKPEEFQETSGLVSEHKDNQFNDQKEEEYFHSESKEKEPNREDQREVYSFSQSSPTEKEKDRKTTPDFQIPRRLELPKHVKTTHRFDSRPESLRETTGGSVQSTMRSWGAEINTERKKARPIEHGGYFGEMSEESERTIGGDEESETGEGITSLRDKRIEGPFYFEYSTRKITDFKEKKNRKWQFDEEPNGEMDQETRKPLGNLKRHSIEEIGKITWKKRGSVEKIQMQKATKAKKPEPIEKESEDELDPLKIYEQALRDIELKQKNEESDEGDSGSWQKMRKKEENNERNFVSFKGKLVEKTRFQKEKLWENTSEKRKPGDLIKDKRKGSSGQIKFQRSILEKNALRTKKEKENEQKEEEELDALNPFKIYQDLVVDLEKKLGGGSLRKSEGKERVGMGPLFKRERLPEIPKERKKRKEEDEKTKEKYNLEPKEELEAHRMSEASAILKERGENEAGGLQIEEQEDDETQKVGRAKKEKEDSVPNGQNTKGIDEVNQENIEKKETEGKVLGTLDESQMKGEETNLIVDFKGNEEQKISEIMDDGLRDKEEKNIEGTAKIEETEAEAKRETLETEADENPTKEPQENNPGQDEEKKQSGEETQNEKVEEGQVDESQLEGDKNQKESNGLADESVQDQNHLVEEDSPPFKKRELEVEIPEYDESSQREEKKEKPLTPQNQLGSPRTALSVHTPPSPSTPTNFTYSISKKFRDLLMTEVDLDQAKTRKEQEEEYKRILNLLKQRVENQSSSDLVEYYDFCLKKSKSLYYQFLKINTTKSPSKNK